MIGFLWFHLITDHTTLRRDSIEINFMIIEFVANKIRRNNHILFIVINGNGDINIDFGQNGELIP